VSPEILAGQPADVLVKLMIAVLFLTLPTSSLVRLCCRAVDLFKKTNDRKGDGVPFSRLFDFMFSPEERQFCCDRRYAILFSC